MLADFGVARWLGQTSNLTGTDMTVGTVTYAAPEQLKGEDRRSRRPICIGCDRIPSAHGEAPSRTLADRGQSAPISEHAGTRDRLGPSPPGSVQGWSSPEHWQEAEDSVRPLPRFRAGDAGRAGVSSGSARHPEGGAGRGRGRTGHRRTGRATVRRGRRGGGVLASGHRGTATRTISTTPPPPAVAARMDLPVVLIGADCAVPGAAAVTGDRWAGVIAPAPIRSPATRCRCSRRSQHRVPKARPDAGRPGRCNSGYSGPVIW